MRMRSNRLTSVKKVVVSKKEISPNEEVFYEKYGF
jgi:hypothetical protein